METRPEKKPRLSTNRTNVASEDTMAISPAASAVKPDPDPEREESIRLVKKKNIHQVKQQYWSDRSFVLEAIECPPDQYQLLARQTASKNQSLSK